jgi:hypothetical protein
VEAGSWKGEEGEVFIKMEEKIMKREFGFKELLVWQKSMDFVDQIMNIIDKLDEKLLLCSSA